MSNSVDPVDIEFVLKNVNFQSEAAKMKAEISGVSLTAEQAATRIKAALSDNIVKYNQAALGVNQYAKSVTGLNFSMQQVARELPSLAISPQMFFLAISNNLPILADNLKRVREENKLLSATGQASTPVWKQMISSIFSWQTALIAGITILTVWGKDIINGISNLFKFRNEIRLTTEEVNKLNDSFAKNAGSEIGKLNYLFDTLNKTKKGTIEYLDTKKEILNQYGSYLKGLDSEITSLNNVKGAYDALSKSIYENAKAKTLKSTYEDLGQNLVAETQKQLGNIYEQLTSKHGQNAGSAFFNQIKAELESGNGLSYPMQRVIDDFKKKVYTAQGTSITGSVQGAAFVEVNVLNDAVKAYTKAQSDFENKIADARRILETKTLGGTPQVKSLINIQQDLLTQAKLMPEATEAEIKAKNKKIEAIEKEIKRLQELGKTSKEQGEYQKLHDQINKASDAVINASEKERPALLEKLRLLIKQREEWEAIIKAQRGETTDMKPITPLGATVATKILDTKTLGVMKLLTEEQRKQLEQKADQMFLDAVAEENYEKRISLVNQMAGALNQITSEYAEQLGLSEDQTQNLKDGMQAIGGIAKIASGDYIGGAVDLISSVGKYLINAPEQLSEHFEHIQEQINKVISSLEVAEQSLSNLGKDSSLTSMKIIKAELLGIADEAKKLNEELAKSSTQKRRSTDMNLPAKDMVKQAADLNAEIEKLSNRLLRGDISDDQRKAIEALLNSYNDLLGVIDNTIQDITGTTINDLGRNLAEAFLTGENAAEAWGEKVDDIIKNVIIRQLTTNLLSGKITEAVNTLVNDSASGEELTTEEAANFKKLMDELYASSAPVFEATQKALSAAGFNLGNASGSAASGLSGSVKGASEETTAALVGQLMAVRVDVKELIKYSAMGQDDVAKSLLYLRQISDNTSYNKELIPISKKLENIENVLRSRL